MRKVILSTVFFLLGICLTLSGQIRVLGMDLHENCKFYRKISSVPINTEKLVKMPVKDRKELAGSIRFFEVKRDEKVKKELNVCEQKLVKFYTSYQKRHKNGGFNTGDFHMQWAEKNPSCFGIYKKIAPKLVIDFAVGKELSGQSLYLEEVITETVKAGQDQVISKINRVAMEDILLSGRTGRQTHDLRKNRLKVVDDGGLTFRLWSAHYYGTEAGKVPGPKKFILRFHFVFSDGDGQKHFAISEFFMIEI